MTWRNPHPLTCFKCWKILISYTNVKAYHELYVDNTFTVTVVCNYITPFHFSRLFPDSTTWWACLSVCSLTAQVWGWASFIMLMMALCKKKKTERKKGKSVNMWLCNSQGLPTCSVCEGRRELAGIQGDGQGLAVPWHCLRHQQGHAGDCWHPWERSLLLPGLAWAHFWGANSPPDEEDEGLMDLYCAWSLFLCCGWRHGRSWAAPLNYRWGHHHWLSGTHVSLCLLSMT